jgi:hypothetical protein
VVSLFSQTRHQAFLAMLEAPWLAISAPTQGDVTRPDAVWLHFSTPAQAWRPSATNAVCCHASNNVRPTECYLSIR